MKNIDEWHKIGNTLSDYFGICRCQRKLKTIVDNLVSIYEKCNSTDENNFTGAEWLIIALMDRNTNAITHGTNCEYPIINKEDEFWKWILEVKDSPYLEDN
jgi:aspartate oxidase